MKQMIIASLNDSIAHGTDFRQFGLWWGLPATVEKQNIIFLTISQPDWEALVDQALASPWLRARRVLDVRRVPAAESGYTLLPETDPATAGERVRAEIVLVIWEDWFDLTVSFRDHKTPRREIYLLRKRCAFVRLALWAIPSELVAEIDPASPGFIIGVEGRDPSIEATKQAIGYFPLGGARLAMVEDDWKMLLRPMMAAVFGLVRQGSVRATTGPMFHIEPSVWEEINRVCEEGMVCEGGMDPSIP